MVRYFADKGYYMVDMFVCKHCGLKALKEKDMDEHLRTKHPTSKYLKV